MSKTGEKRIFRIPKEMLVISKRVYELVVYKRENSTNNSDLKRHCGSLVKREMLIKATENLSHFQSVRLVNGSAVRDVGYGSPRASLAGV